MSICTTAVTVATVTADDWQLFVFRHLHRLVSQRLVNMEGLDEKLNAKFSPMEVKTQRCMDHLDELQQILNDSTKIAHAITEVGVQMHDTDALAEEANGEFLFVNR